MLLDKELAVGPVANAIKLLQASIYKSVNPGLSLTSLAANCIVKFIMLMLCSLSFLYVMVKPSLKKGIGMGYVKTENAKIGETIFVKIRNNNIPAQIVKLPFYKV